MRTTSIFAKMKFLLFATLLVGAYTAPYDTAIMKEWNDYKTEYGKHYTSAEEDNRRLETYLATKKRVQEHNLLYEQGQASWTMGINKFADWYPEERSMLNGLKVDENRPKQNLFRLEPGREVPDSINWVKKGAVTSIKNQGHCGSCYAFSAIGALEGLMFRTNKSIQSLSTQEIVDCSRTYGNNGCEGGLMNYVFNYVIDRKGVDSDKSYPYTAEDGICQAKEGTIVASCNCIMTIESGNETALKEAVGTVGPVSFGFAVGNDFIHYNGGIFDGSCEIYINHGMLLVGYGKDNATGQDYWLVKNSWGKCWGEQGYVRVIRGKNKCLLSALASFPSY